MGIMRRTFVERLRNELSVCVVETKGYITKATREKLLVLPKSHVNDALAIAHGKAGFNCSHLSMVTRQDKIYTIRPVRHHNRQIHKATILKGGYRKASQAPRYVFGFRLFDKVRWNGQDYFISARRNSGSFKLNRLDVATLKDGVSYKKIRLLERSNNYLIC